MDSTAASSSARDQVSQRDSDRHRSRSRERGAASSRARGDDRRRSRSRSNGRDRRKHHRHASKHKKHRSRSRSHSKHRHSKKHSHKHSSKHRRRSHSRSSDSSSSSDSSRDHSRRREAASAAIGAVASVPGVIDQRLFGSRGILRDQDVFRKQAEFDAWMREVKNIPGFHGPKNEMMEFWREYAEDYNCCCLPHEKYYDIDKWEASERSRDGPAGTTSRAAGFSLVEDQEARRQEAIAARAKLESERMAMVRQSLGGERLAAMKRQQELQQAMQYAFRAGNAAEAERIKKLLEPEDPREKLGR